MGERTDNAGSLRPAHVYAAMRDWPGYFAAVAGKPPRETLVKALDLFGPWKGEAVDFGCGEGRDAAELLRRGWNVVAIDAHPEAFQRLLSRPDLAGRDRLRVVMETFERADLPACDLLNASYSLPFCSPEAFAAVWERIVRAIRPGGRFAGQLFGDRDTWAKLPDRSHQTEAEARRLLGPFDVEHFTVEEKSGNDAEGNPKDWHIFHIVARKR